MEAGTKQNDTKSGHAWTRFLPEIVRRKIEGRKNFLNIIANTGWLFFDKIVRMGVGLLVGVWVARYLGPEQFGLFSYVSAFIWLFASFANLGLDAIVIRDIVKKPGDRNILLGTAFVLKLLGGLGTILVCLTAIYFVRHGDHQAFVLAMIISIGMIFQSLDFIDLWFQSQVLSKYTVIAKNVAFLLMALVKVCLILTGASLVAFAAAGTVEIALGAGGLFLAFRMQGQRMSSLSFDKACASRLLRTSWPLIFSSMFIALYMKIDQVMLGNMIGDKAVGIYSAAVRISEVWIFVPVAMVSSVYPAIVKAKHENTEIYMTRLLHLYTTLIWMAVALAVPLLLASPYIVNALFGAKYHEASSVLSIHIWTALFTFYGSGKSIFLQCENMQFYMFITTGIGAVSNILLNVILIPQFGVIGAAYATLLSQIICAIIIPVMYKRDRINVVMFFKAFMYPYYYLKKQKFA